MIRKSDDYYSLNPVDIQQVKNAEDALSVAFAEDYKEYVKEFGAVSFDGHELTGICESKRLSVVLSTERARQFYANFPPNMYVIEELQFDHVLIVQDATGTVYSYGPSDKCERIASSLEEYLVKN